MKLGIRAFVVATCISAAAAFAQQAPGGAPASPAAAQAGAPAGGPQSANIFDPAREQVERQKTQPMNNAPVWREVNSGATHYTSVQGRETGVLIQKGGEQWRQLRPSMYGAGGVVIAAVLAVLMLFYAWRGPIQLHEAPTGRYIRRFSTADRIAHWSMAGSFVVLGLTGLVLTFGKFVLLPVIGYTLFGWLANLAKNLHNFVGPIFVVSLPVFIVIYLRDNLPKLHDLNWLIRMGGIFSKHGGEVPSDRFNAGEKVVFWLLVCVISLVLAVSGLVLDFPNFDQTRAAMQLANTVHLVAAMIGTVLACGHIYLGTVGMRGAFEAMRYGYVDETWAREHHALWYEDVKSGRARQRFADPQEDVPAEVRTAARIR